MKSIPQSVQPYDIITVHNQQSTINNQHKDADEDKVKVKMRRM